jgi:hypothetical protein
VGVVGIAPGAVLVVVPAGAVVGALVALPLGAAPGVVRPAPAGDAGMLAAGTVVPGVLVAGVLVRGVLVAGVLAAPAAAAGAVAVLVIAGVFAAELPELPASETSAALSAPRESRITALSAITGARQLGIAARRVRAAAPHRRHHSCSACNGAPHSGHPSMGGVDAGDGGGGAVTVTCRRPWAG